MDKDNKIAIFVSKGLDIQVKVRLDKNTIWLDAHQMADLFGVKRPAVVKHIQNIYKASELPRNSTCSKMEQVARDGRIREMKIYNLDMIISVGYRVNSKQATQFRIWATTILKKYLVQGYAINKKRLEEANDRFAQLQETIKFLTEKSERKNLQGQETELLKLLNSYSRSLTYLDQFDQGNLPDIYGSKDTFELTYDKAAHIIRDVKHNLIEKGEATDLFGSQRGDSFKSVIGNLYQSFGGNDLYPSIEAKAAHLLYFVIKDHPFSDGNKRSGSFLFVYFLDKNDYLYKNSGEKKINDNALTALALLVAESDPKEKDLMIKLIMNLIAD